jgi:uncharacterized protein YdaU (DUF1376 family)
MNYYPHHISDFNNATRHLSRIERSLYRDMLDIYYDTEAPLPLDVVKLSRKLIAISTEESTAVEQVLNEFFKKTDAGWYNGRCEEVIFEYHKNISAKSAAGKASAAKREETRLLELNKKATAVEQVLNDRGTGAQLTSNQEPVTSNQKPKEKTFSSDSDEFRLSKMLFSFIEKRNPKNKEPNMQSWARNIDLMLRVDGRLPEDIERVIRWCQADNFWQNNILSTGKLREKFDALMLKAGGAVQTKQTKVMSASGVQYEF